MKQAPTSLDQQRAAFAWKVVGEKCSSDYANLAKSAPALIMGNGLMQMLAFFEAKGKDHHRKLSGDICKRRHLQMAGQSGSDYVGRLSEGDGSSR